MLLVGHGTFLHRLSHNTRAEEALTEALALLPTGGSKRGTEQWALGPAVGFTARKGKLLWGAFNQNLFTYAGDDNRTPVNASVLQPIVSYGLGHGWSAGCSEMTFTYDYEAGRWASLPRCWFGSTTCGSPSTRSTS